MYRSVINELQIPEKSYLTVHIKGYILRKRLDMGLQAQV
jgi:hypothetical protein